MPSHTVNQGDCLSSIAKRYGLDWKAVWEHPDNKKLRDLRKNPNVLYPGDVVAIPEKKQKEEAVPLGATHQFEVKRPKAMLRLRILSAGKPVANSAYKLTVDGVEIEPGKEKKTNGDGLVIATIRPHAKEARVELTEQKITYVVRLGHLDPITEMTGVQSRLRQLGFYPGQIDGTYGRLTSIAVWAFQTQQKITPTGKIDQATRAALEKAYGM